MLTPLMLLLAGLSDAGTDRATRARLQEMRGRLGLQRDRAPSDYRARLRYALTRPGVTAEQSVAVLWALHRIEPWSDDPHSGWRVELEFLSELGDKPMADSRVAAWLDDLLPPRGMRSRYEPMVTWISDQVYTGMPHLDLPELIDWYEATGPDLGGYTMAEARAAAAQWHRQFQRLQGRPEPAPIIGTWPDGYTLQRPVTKSQLMSEGDHMGHCVGSYYWSAVRDEQAIILSMRDGDGMSLATIELVPTSLQDFSTPQIRGPDNAIIDNEEVRARLYDALSRLGVVERTIGAQLQLVLWTSEHDALSAELQNRSRSAASNLHAQMRVDRDIDPDHAPDAMSWLTRPHDVLMADALHAATDLLDALDLPRSARPRAFLPVNHPDLPHDEPVQTFSGWYLMRTIGSIALLYEPLSSTWALIKPPATAPSRPGATAAWHYASGALWDTSSDLKGLLEEYRVVRFGEPEPEQPFLLHSRDGLAPRTEFIEQMHDRGITDADGTVKDTP